MRRKNQWVERNHALGVDLLHMHTLHHCINLLFTMRVIGMGDLEIENGHLDDEINIKGMKFLILIGVLKIVQLIEGERNRLKYVVE